MKQRAEMEEEEARKKERERIRLAEETLNIAKNSIVKTGFVVSKSWMLSETLCGIFVDDVHNQIALRADTGIKLIKYTDVLEFSLEEDGYTVSSSTTQTIGTMTTKGTISGNMSEALAGATLFGSTGAIIGASAGRRINQTSNINTTSEGTTVESNICSSLSISLFVNDFDSSYIKLPFISSDTYKNSPTYSSAKTSALEVAGVLTYITNKTKLGKADPPTVITYREDELMSSNGSDVSDKTEKNLIIDVLSPKIEQRQQQEDDIKCPACSTMINGLASYCPSCGEKLSGSEQSAFTRHKA